MNNNNNHIIWWTHLLQHNASKGITLARCCTSVWGSKIWRCSRARRQAFERISNPSPDSGSVPEARYSVITIYGESLVMLPGASPNFAPHFGGAKSGGSCGSRAWWCSREHRQAFVWILDPLSELWADNAEFISHETDNNAEIVSQRLI